MGVYSRGYHLLIPPAFQASGFFPPPHLAAQSPAHPQSQSQAPVPHRSAREARIPEFVEIPLSVRGMEAVTSIWRIGRVVRDCAEAVCESIAPREDLGFDNIEIALWAKFCDEIVCDILYD